MLFIKPEYWDGHWNTCKFDDGTDPRGLSPVPRFLPMLMQVSRQVRAELLPLMYRHNFFDFWEQRIARPLVRRRFDSVHSVLAHARNLEMVYYVDNWPGFELISILDMRKNLETVKISLFGGCGASPTKLGDGRIHLLLGTLLRNTKVQVFFECYHRHSWIEPCVLSGHNLRGANLGTVRNLDADADDIQSLSEGQSNFCRSSLLESGVGSQGWLSIRL